MVGYSREFDFAGVCEDGDDCCGEFLVYPNGEAKREDMSDYDSFPI